MVPTRRREPEGAFDTAVPRFTIDLSLDPEYRYVALAKHYRPQIQRLTALFDDLLSDLSIPQAFHKTIHRVARLLLRKVHSTVETLELRGIARTARIPIYLLVTLNLVLDMLMGCTSGAAKALEEGQDAASARMLHFRTLDWGMDPLRSVVVQLDFIRSKWPSGPQILGSSVTYVGFVGVLTGVREGLSVSLNFRAVHNASTKTQHFRFYFHNILVLLGLRQSISSMLRSCLFGSDKNWSESPRTLDDILDTVPQKHTTAAYLIFCDGQFGITLEKDFDRSVMHKSDRFIVTTNHDLDPHKPTPQEIIPSQAYSTAMQELLDESEDRRNCIVQKWEAKLQREKRRRQRNISNNTDATTRQSLRSLSLRSGKGLLEHHNLAEPTSTRSSVDMDDIAQSVSVTREELARWTSAFPTTNECTHYAAILDPANGEVVWSRRYLERVEVTLD